MTWKTGKDIVVVFQGEPFSMRGGPATLRRFVARTIPKLPRDNLPSEACGDDIG